jgi:hypothetical protein
MEIIDILPFLMIAVGIYLGFTLSRIKDLLIDYQKSPLGHLEPETTLNTDKFSDEKLAEVNGLKRRAKYLTGVIVFLVVTLIMVLVLS